MSLKVLIVPDKFKGTLTARAAAEAIARGWRRSRPADLLELLPMTDGGDGFGELIGGLLDAKRASVATVDAAHRRRRAAWWWEPKTKTAIIESAAVIGLARVRGIHPFELDTFGLGAVLRAAKRKGARRCLVGIGGSATNDGGFGVARALGWEFLDRAGKLITSWTQLHSLADLRGPGERRLFPELFAAVDVRNPLLGVQGCTRIFGPQKGLARADFAPAELCLRRLALVARRHLKRDYSAEPGAGAAGGLGFGLRCFLGAQLQPGFELFARSAKLEARLRKADLVITGEGAIDQSTLMGKGVGQIAQRCRKLLIPCLGLAGKVTPQAHKANVFTAAHALTELAAEEDAKHKPGFWLERLATRVAQDWHG